MITKSESEIIQDGHQCITMLGELLEQLKQENEELREKLGMGERTQCPASFDVLAVTNVRVWPFVEGPSMGHMKGIAEVTLNEQLVIRGLRIMEGVDGMFVGFPIDPFYKGEEFRHIVTPITKKLKMHIENCVLEKFQQAVSEG